MPRQSKLSSALVLVPPPAESSPEELIANASSAEDCINVVRNLDSALHEPLLLAIASDPEQATSVRYAAITHGLSRQKIVSADWAAIAMRTDILMVAAPVIAKMDVDNAQTLYMIAKDAQLDNTQALAIGRLGSLKLHDQLRELSSKLDNPRLLKQIRNVFACALVSDTHA